MKKIWNCFKYNHLVFCIVYYLLVLGFLMFLDYNNSKLNEKPTIKIIDSIQQVNNNLDEELIFLDSIKTEYINNAESIDDSAAVSLFWELLQRE